MFVSVYPLTAAFLEMSCSVACDEWAKELFSQHLYTCKITSFMLCIKPLENCKDRLRFLSLQHSFAACSLIIVFICIITTPGTAFFPRNSNSMVAEFVFLKKSFFSSWLLHKTKRKGQVFSQMFAW